ncbi:MAG: hypothetical protein MRY78_17545, partial [Saprospiraceae bacterium]|nr:hypothetical protein [Saprospiraceae bacterium]
YLAILNLRLGFTQSAILYLDTSGETPKINAIYGAAGFAFKLGWNNPQLNSTNIDVTENGINIPFGGDNNGQCLFNIQPKEGVFYQLFANETRSSNAPASAEMRYTFGSADQLITLRYPIFTGVNPEIPTNKTMLDLLVAVDPLKITDSDRTYFDFNFDSINKDLFTIPDTQFFNNTYGSAIQMAPSQGAGFGLGLRPAQNDANTTYLYLLPKGPFELKNGANGNGLVQLLCGTNSTEFLLLAEGDYLQFSTNENASSAPNFTPVSNAPVNNVNQLTAATTTSYLGVQAGAQQSSAFANISFQESYCVQSEGMIFFNEVSGAYYSSVIGCRLAGLTSQEDQAPFPMVPYQGIYTSDPSQTYQNPNKQIQGTFFEQLEAEVLRPNRRAIIQPDLCLGPVFFDLLSPTLAPISGYVLTAQGLLVKLNDGNNDAQPKGSWQELILAKSPINPDQYLKIGVCDDCGDCTDTSYEVVNPYLSNALMSAAPLIVMTQDKFGEHKGQSAFANEIQLDEFTFEINLDRNDKLKEGEDQTILIFKQSTENSVKELCETTSLWGYAEYFISTEQPDIQAVSQAILDSITEAESKTGKERIWFEDFIEKMTNPSWTGVIALNCSLDYSALPIDIQMLLGGIHGQLMAHHFGLTDNNIENNFSGDEIPIQNSSLFGLVYYNHPTPTTYTDSDNHFETLILNALFKNSVLTNFQARIAMTIPKVFEEWATLTQYTFVNNEWKALPAAVAGQNIIEIDGVYQAPEDPNGIGTVVFDSKDHFVFDFGTDTLRVLDKVVVTDAALVPITESTNDKGITQVTAYFEMIGGIGFTDSIGIDPNNDHGDVDAFSFEATIDFSKKGLGLRGYNFQILTEIKGNRAVLGPDIPTLYDEIQTFIQKTGDSNQARSGSLYNTFPLEYVDLIYNLSTGITASSVEGAYMTGLGTPEINTTSSSDYPPVLEAVPPNFALQFKTNFGSLGALVSEDSILNAQFFLGWTASGSESQTNGKPNEVAMIFQPPDGVSLDGSFKIEGVFNSSYNQVVLDRYPLSGLAGAPIVFVVSLMDANLNLLSLPLLPDSGYAITLFGIPLVNTSSNLTWFTGNPLHVELDVYPPPSPPKVDFIFQPYIGLMSALEINTAVTGTLNINVIGPTITKLVNLPNSTLQFIQQLTDGDEDIVLYNPNSKILLWFVLNFESLTLQGIFNDPSFYGGYLKVGKPAKKKDDKGDNGNEKALAQADNNDNGDDDKKGIMSILTGLEIVFVYRKISDTLGVYAAQLVLPDKFREFEIGGFGFELPSVGVEVWTNGDFKVEVGWPFGSTNSFAPAGTQFKVTVPIEPPPLQLGLFAGFYFAKLRSEDAPDVFAGSDFSLIYMFGIGVGLEVGVEKNWSVIKFNASLSIWGTFEGMLASQKGVITDNGIDYYWFAGQLGLTLNVTGKVNFGIIKSSLEFEASIIAGLALERYHLVTFSATFMIKIEFQVKMVFFTIKFRFSFELTLFTFTLGAQGDKPAELSGPTAPFTAADANSTNSPVQKKTAQFEEAQVVNLEEITPTKLEVYFTLQSTAVQTDTNAAFASYAVASFVISIDEFTNMVKALMPYMAFVYGGSTLTDQLNNILANISTIENDALTTMGTLFTVEVDAGSSADSSSGDSMEVGIFALPPGLQMTYAGNTINFDKTQSSPDYLQTVQDYFNQLQDDTVENPSLATASTVPVTQVLFENYFGLVVQGAAATMLSSIQNGTTYANLTDALDDLDYDSLSGSVSRYLQAGLQLPVPSDTSTLAPMYALTNQQVAVAFDKDGNPILEFDLSAQSTLPSWLSLKTNSDGNLVENLDASQVFNDPQVTDSWMGNAANIDPIKPFVRIFQLTTSQQWTDSTGTNWNMRPFTDDLSSLIQNASQGELAKMYIAELAQNANAQQQDVDNLTKVNTTPGLLIKFKIQQLPKKQISGSNNTYMENVYQVIGTDENTRDLIQEVLDNNDLSSIANVHFLT